MAQIYGPPPQLPVPVFDYQNVEASFKVEEEWVKKLAEWVKAQYGDTELGGEEVRFSVADGYARYLVVRTKPLMLMHLPLGDAYHADYVKRMTLADIRRHVKSAKAIEALFARKS